MMNKLESDRQAQALIKFANSIGQPIGPRWPWRRTREPRAHREWRRACGIVHRFKLYADAQIEEITPLMRQLYYEAANRERRAYRKWLAHKHRRSMSFLTGDMKTPPPWGC
jgi:hypothetical protein